MKRIATLAGLAAVTINPDGSAVVVGGTAPGASGGSVFVVTAYAIATGAPLWTQRHRGPGPDNAANAVTVSPDGTDVFVTGSSTGNVAGLVDYTTVGYATASGARLWATNYQPPPGVNVPQGAEAAGVSPDGSLVYVTGGTPGNSPNTVNYTTIAYRTANGQPSWATRYKGPRNFGFATSLAVGPTGQGVFVTGFIGVHDGCCNFGTVAYQP
jgi:hypothetical protein